MTPRWRLDRYCPGESGRRAGPGIVMTVIIGDITMSPGGCHQPTRRTRFYAADRAPPGPPAARKFRSGGILPVAVKIQSLRPPTTAGLSPKASATARLPAVRRGRRLHIDQDPAI